MSTKALGILIVAVSTGAFCAQQTQPALDPGQAEELQRARTIITDLKASPEVRRIGAEDLLRLTYPAATDLAIEILQGNGDPLPRIAVCEAIATVGGSRADDLDCRLVTPLLDLLDAEDQTLRSRAVAALAAFRDGGVAGRLGELAADEQATLSQRLAAVDALAPNVDQSLVIEALVGLLEAQNAELRTRVLAALRPASRVDYGTDVKAWQQWWQTKDALDPAAWLRDRIDLLREKHRALQLDLEAVTAESARRCSVLSGRLAEQLQNVYRLTPPPQKEDLLIKWLADPLLEFRRAAVSAIAVNISDGNLPGEAVRTALRERFADPSADLRRSVLDVIAALTDPADVDPVLSLLETEKDPAVLEVVLRTLGRLQNPSAIPALIAVLSDPDAPEGCWAEAATSLGLLGMRGKVSPEIISPATEPLLQRFAAAPPESLRLRAAVLGAMANIGAAEFANEFLANLEATEPELLLTALQGVCAAGDAGCIDRVLALMGNDDPRVRRAAAETIGALGSEPAHVEVLLNRLNPAIEPSERVRQTAWASFRRILSGKPPAEYLQWADRLEGFPELEEAYLAELIGNLADRQPPPAELNVARARAAELYDANGRFAESLPLWRELWQRPPAAGGPPQSHVGLRLLRACLETNRLDNLAPLLKALTATAEPAQRAEVADMVLGHLQAAKSAEQDQTVELLLNAIDQLPADTFGADFNKAVSDVRPSPAPSPTSAPAEPAEADNS